MMRLSSLLPANVTLPNEADFVVSGLALDSRRVQGGDVFIALSGSQSDGREFIPAAMAAGARAILLDAQPGEACSIQQGIPFIPVPQLRERLGEIAATFYGHPSQHMKVIGVTGTNGKTSCTHFIAQALEYCRIRCGVMGTLGSGLYGELGEPGLTTPDAITLQATLKQFFERGAKAAAMEVSSHSIDQARVNGIVFSTGIFTNLTQDHLDYHGTMAAYAAVKKRLFTDFSMKNRVINMDDEYGYQWLTELNAAYPLVAYGLQPRVLPMSIPQLYTEDTSLSLHGIHTRIISPWGRAELNLPLVGQFNLSNVLAVLATLCLEEIPFKLALAAISELQAVPGRMSLLGGNGRPLVAVDYSHTPDALEKALQALRAHTKGKLICVFGCGGNRDAAKRPIMASIAERFADKVIVTNDNPRHEDPEDIAQQILRGFQHPENVLILLDRSKAIEKSIQYAAANDCILVAGKGAERYQQIGEQKFPFDDACEVSRFLKDTVNESQSHGDI